LKKFKFWDGSKQGPTTNIVQTFYRKMGEAVTYSTVPLVYEREKKKDLLELNEVLP
jgi:hypothetical protein